MKELIALKKLKLLVFARDDRSYTVPAARYFLEELGKAADLRVTHAGGRAKDIVESIDFEPDFIYFNDYLENGSPIVTGLGELTVPYAVGLHDLHHRFSIRKKILQEEGVKYVFTHYRDFFLRWYPEFAMHMRWIPHHANTDVFKDYGLEKDIGLLLAGALTEPYYPLRSAVVRRFSGRPEFVLLPHPGYRRIGENESGVRVGRAYAMELNRAKICLTCDSALHYTVMKYFEIPACNSLLLAPCNQEILDLGFIPGVHFVSIDEHDFEEKAHYYLEHEDERKKIALNGMRLVHEKHSTRRRAAEFVEAVRGILAETSQGSD